MPMHPHAQPNFRNLFWYPFKITLITALRTFPFFGKRLGEKLDWGYHNKLTPEKLIVFLTDALTQSNIIFERMLRKASTESEKEELIHTTPINRFHRQGFLSLFLM